LPDRSGEGALVRLLAGEQASAAEAYLAALEALFPSGSIELARRGDAAEMAAEPALIDLAYARDLPLVATNPACFAERAFYAAHDALLCIASSTHVDSTDRPRSSSEWWIKGGPLDGRDLRRRARGAGEHARCRAARRLQAALPQADPPQPRGRSGR